METSEDAREIVFVGGTGRSGTHILAALLGRHSRYRDVPIECRFHTNPMGFPDLLAGRVTLEAFLRKLRRFWWHRIKAGELAPAVLPRLPLGREERGLYKIVPRERFDAAVSGFEAAYADDPVAACRNLFCDLLWPLAVEAGKPGLVEMSTDSVAVGETLLRIFPGAKLIHTVRDGRDAGSSKVSLRQKKHHPRDVLEGIDWWEGRLRRNDEAARRLPPAQLHELSLDDLVELDREPAYAALRRFLGIDDEPSMREFFETAMSPESAHRGRWREGLSQADLDEAARGYEAALERLEAGGIRCAPVLRRVYERDR